ncbi:alpha-ribazole-5-phosphate synthase [Clostridium sp. MSJ-11]|uniref:Alpha-ribazole-5-phosphate synthase n=1 Tax=Clostridium mobile TaxID=2841512 RepID=A0ABS6EMF9_9CLOT|nr:AIR synthase related protein [Clostridium mobile]MBU5485605.1 alpha-ribazole-5-phosphate synthase [Clostridium mobile]
MKINKIRDLTLVSIDSNKTMVIACDSCGSIGMKEGDALKVPSIFVGKLTLRVAMFEVLSSGANIVAITNAVCNEMEPTGKEIIKGIEEELECAGIDKIALNGSTEENFKTTSTALGITVVGIVDNANLKVNNIKEDCLLISIGMPKVGGEINLSSKDEDIADYDDLYKMLETQGVFEIVPVGSKGILYEGELLARNNNMNLNLVDNMSIDLHKTCGPATVLIAAVSHEAYENLKTMKRVRLIGKLNKN